MRLLESGYSIVKREDMVITNIDSINIGDLLTVTLKDGVIATKVISKEGKNGQE